MKLLLDTHIFLWWVNDDKLLPKVAKREIDNAMEVYISSVSIWEIAIKVKTGKFEVDVEKLANAVAASGFSELSLTTNHVRAVSHLPKIHHDPFDRILIAQAMSEPLKFLTADKALKDYSDLIMCV